MGAFQWVAGMAVVAATVFAWLQLGPHFKRVSDTKLTSRQRLGVIQRGLAAFGVWELSLALLLASASAAGLSLVFLGFAAFFMIGARHPSLLGFERESRR